MTIRPGKGNKHLLCLPEGQGSSLALKSGNREKIVYCFPLSFQVMY
jgi:hypothetical protein